MVEWGNNEDRLQWHQEVSDEYDQHCADPSYVCSADFITKASQFGPAEIAIHTPYRAGDFIICLSFNEMFNLVKWFFLNLKYTLSEFLCPLKGDF